MSGTGSSDTGILRIIITAANTQGYPFGRQFDSEATNIQQLPGHLFNFGTTSVSPVRTAAPPLSSGRVSLPR